MAAHIVRHWLPQLSAQWLAWFMRFYPPYWGAGVVIPHASPDFRSISVGLKLRWWNRNYVGTAFGGSLYSMTDPFYMLMLIRNLGSEYIVWDKAASIDFVKPGRMDVMAEFKIDETLLADVRSKTATGDKYVFDLPVEIRDLEGLVVARVTKTMYVRKKKRD